MNSIVLFNGYFTYLTAVSILEQLGVINKDNIFLSYLNHSKGSDINEYKNIINKTCGESSVYNYFDYLYKNKFNKKKFQEEIKVFSIKYILIPINSSTKKWYKLFKSMYPSAQYVFYDEGLMSLVKPLVDIKLNSILKKSKVFYNDIDKTIGDYLLKNKGYSLINKDILKKNFKKMRATIDFTAEDLALDKTKNVLFLPQYYGKNNPKNNALKIKKYVEVINNLQKKGYRVILKDHPKHGINKDIIKFIKISHKYKDIDLLEKIVDLSEINNYPVELFLEELNINFVFSVYSTSLFTARSLYDIPAFTSYKMLKERIGSFSLYPYLTCKLVMSFIPDVNNYLKYYLNNPNNYTINFKHSSKKTNIFLLSKIKLISQFLFK